MRATFECDEYIGRVSLAVFGIATGALIGLYLYGIAAWINDDAVYLSAAICFSVGGGIAGLACGILAGIDRLRTLSIRIVIAIANATLVCVILAITVYPCVRTSWYVPISDPLFALIVTQTAVFGAVFAIPSGMAIGALAGLLFHVIQTRRAQP